MGKWMKSLVGLNKCEKDHNHQEKATDSNNNKGKKWKLWRSSSGSRQSEATSVASTEDTYNAAKSVVVRAPPRDFHAIRQEWASIRIQTAFRSFLARRALKALKAIVKIQAIVRGRQVRKEFAFTFKCMQALVRVQEKVQAQRLALSSDPSALENTQSSPTNPDKLAEDGWCDKQGSVDQIKAKIQMKQEGAIKRERALNYAFSSQQWRAVTPNRKSSSLKSQEIDFSKPNSFQFQVKRNNISTRIGLKPSSFSDFEESSPPSSCSPVGNKSTKARMSQQRTALSNVHVLESGGHVSVKRPSGLGLKTRGGDNNKENIGFDGKMSPFT